MSYEDELIREATGEHEPRPFNPFGDDGEAETLEAVEPNVDNEPRRRTRRKQMITRKLPRRKQGETLIAWLDRARSNDLNNGQFINALWMSDLIRRVSQSQQSTTATH